MSASTFSDSSCSPEIHAETSRVEICARSIERLRERLLDLSARNRLLNFPFSQGARQVRVVNEVPNLLYERVLSGNKQFFEALPEADHEPPDEDELDFRLALEGARQCDEEYQKKLLILAARDASIQEYEKLERELRNRVRKELGMLPLPNPDQMTRFEWAKIHGINPSYDLPQSLDDLGHATNPGSNRLQLLLYPQEMQRKLSGIREAARSALAEMGVNVLYMAFGFLEWYESENGKRKFFAPLLLHPLEIFRELKYQKYRYAVASLGEDTEINYTLKARLAKDFGVVLPDFDDSELPESYFSKVEDAIKDLKGWRVRRFVAVAPFQFTNIAMYHDLDPENWNHGRPLHEHPILLDLLTGKEEQGELFAQDYDVDAPDVGAKVSMLIDKADASQISAVVDVMSGRNTVIYGPPGTGKSQTITNIIAAALHEGKSVLFMAEKMAALEVVKKRLDEAGFGDFCLELHSTKARRADVLESLKKRLQLSASGSDSIHDDLREEYDELCAELKRYTDKLHTKIGDQEWTVHDALWAYLLAKSETERLGAPNSLYELELNGAESFTRSDMDRRIRLLEAIEQLAVQLKETYGSLYSHPWYGMNVGNLSPFEYAALKERVEGWASAVSQLVDRVRSNSELGLSTRSIVADVQNLVSVIRSLPEDDRVQIDTLSILIRNDAYESAQSFFEQLQEYNRLIREIHDLVRHNSRLTPDTISDLAGQWEATAKDVAQLKGTVANLGHTADNLEKFAQSLSDLKHWAHPLLELVSPSVEPSLMNIERLVTAVRMLRDVPRQALSLRTESLVHPDSESVLVAAEEQAKELVRERELLTQDFILQASDDPEELEANAKALRSAGLLSVLSSDVRRAKRAWIGRRRTRGKANREQMAADLERLAGYYRGIRDLETNQFLKQICGTAYRGIDTNFDHLLSIVDFAKEVRRQFSLVDAASVAFRHLLLHGDREILDALMEGVDERREKTFSDLKVDLDNSGFVIDEKQSVDDIQALFLKTANELRTLYADLKELGIRDEVEFSQLPYLIQLIADANASQAVLDCNASVSRVLGNIFSGADTDIVTLGMYLDIARKLRSMCGEETSRRILTVWAHSGLHHLNEIADRLEECIENELKRRKAVLDLCPIDWPSFIEAEEPSQASLEILANRLKAIREDENGLASWAELVRLFEEGSTLEVDIIWQAFTRRRQELVGLKPAFEMLFFRTLLITAYKNDDELKRLSGARQEQLRDRFRRVDQLMIERNRHLLATRLLRNKPPAGNGIGPKSTWTNLALLENEISKQRRHIPLRKLIQRAAGAIQALKPCWMMSPASVAQFLEPGYVEFDLLVIDEASQLKPEEAIGAIARSKQVVIVGDPEQLPPTTFFHRIAVDNEDDLEESIDQESILDQAKNIFRPARRLLWHYRSRHESLIAFSNEHFYDKSLVVFPSPTPAAENLGVRYVYVEGIYQPRVNVNPIEAETVVETAIRFMKENAEKSLGIVCMNKSQTDYIVELMNERLAVDPDAEAYRQRWEHTLEPFFVKNLENVQGDERDVIFVSTVFGPDKPGGKVAQQFGPINLAHGHRRLNVLFSRAKEQLVLFSSLKPDDVVPSATSSRGVRVLRDYILYAKNVSSTFKIHTDHVLDSHFKQFIVKVLEKHGFKAAPNVGVQGYFIDIGVVDPDNPTEFLAGLECDGETYHSARSIKERDRLREERLVALGWNIYRIWSIDWFHDPEREINRLITYLNGLRKQSNVGDVALRDPEPVSDKKQNLKDFTADAGRETAAALEKAEAIKVSMEAEPGVTIILSFADNPDIFHTFAYSDQGEDLSQGLLAVDSPLGQRLINARIKDPIEVNWGGERRKVIVHEKKLPKYKPKKRFEPDSWRYW